MRSAPSALRVWAMMVAAASRAGFSASQRATA
jgi:hypothetical protein